MGRPDDIKEELSTSVKTSQKGKLPSSLNKSAATDIKATETVANEINNGNVEFMVQQINHELEAPSDSSIVQKHTIKPSCSSTPQLQSELWCYCAELGPVPPSIPDKMWVPAWTPWDSKSFSELILDKMKGPTNKPPTKRRKVDWKTAVITNPEYAEKLRKIKEKEQSKKQKWPIKTKNRARKKINYQASESTESGIEIESESEGELTEDEAKWRETKQLKRQQKLLILSYWCSLCGTQFHHQLRKKIFCNNGMAVSIKSTIKAKEVKKQSLFVAKATRCFLTDENGKAYALEMESVKPKIGSGTILESVLQHLGWDISVYPLYNIITGPLEVIRMKKNMEYSNLCERNRII